MHTASSQGRGSRRDLLPGLGLCVLLATFAMQLGRASWLQAHGFNALTLSIVLGIVLGNTCYPRMAACAGSGVSFTKQTLLRAGVVFYGLRLTLHDIGNVGAAGVLIDALVVISTFTLAVTLGTRLLRLERKTCMLIGAGSAICGAAAVMATEPVVRAEADHVTIAVSTVVVFGTAAMFLYPALYPLLPHAMTPAGARAFGVYAGSTIHEVAQVFAAGRAVSESVAHSAVITKMVRVMMLAPFLMGLAAWIARAAGSGGDAVRIRTSVVPWFAVAFVGVVLVNSLVLLPSKISDAANTADTLLLAMAMAALGLGTRISVIRAAGAKPLWLGAMLFVWLIVGGALINATVSAWLG